MYNIIIISKAAMGLRGLSYGLDGPPLHKVSSKLKKALKKHCESLNIPVSISVDNFTGDLKMFKRDGGDLILISPYIASAFLPLEEEEEKYCLVMTEKMFIAEDLSPIIDKIKNL